MLDELMLYLVKFNLFKQKKLLAEIEDFSVGENEKNLINEFSEEILEEELEMKNGFSIIHFYIENQYTFYLHLHQNYQK